MHIYVATYLYGLLIFRDNTTALHMYVCMYVYTYVCSYSELMNQVFTSYNTKVMALFNRHVKMLDIVIDTILKSRLMIVIHEAKKKQAVCDE